MMFITPDEIVGEHVECHLGGDLGQTLRQEVHRAHPHLQRAKRVLGRLATVARSVQSILTRPRPMRTLPLSAGVVDHTTQIPKSASGYSCEREASRSTRYSRSAALHTRRDTYNFPIEADRDCDSVSTGILSRGAAHDKMAFAYCRVRYRDNFRSFHRSGNSERSNRNALAIKLQSMGRLQLRGPKDFREGAEGNGTERELRSLPRLQMSRHLPRQ